MTNKKEPYDHTHPCLVKNHPGYFVVVYPNKEELDKDKCQPENETVYDILHQDDGLIASEASCCPAHAFRDARETIDQHQGRLESTALTGTTKHDKPTGEPEKARRKSPAATPQKIPATTKSQTGGI